MPKPSLTRPTKDDVMLAIRKFDEENREIERLLGLLFSQYPQNTVLSGVSPHPTQSS